MKKTIVLLLIGFIIFGIAAKDSEAARRSKKQAGVLTQEQQTSMAATLDTLTKKMYANSLFSPEDNAKLIDVKLKLDNQMLISPDVALAPLYYKAANLYLAREYKKEAVDCYQTILENFPDTALAPKAKQALESMGIAVKSSFDEEGETTGQAADIGQSASEAIQQAS